MEADRSPSEERAGIQTLWCGIWSHRHSCLCTPPPLHYVRNVGIRPAIQITPAYFGNVNRAYEHTPVWHLVAQTFLSVRAADAPLRSQRRIRPAIQITLAYFGNANRAYEHASARHLVAQTFLSVHAAEGRHSRPSLSPEVAMAPPVI